MGNSGLSRFLPKLREWKESTDEAVANAAAWAIAQLEKP
jgi:hypothetical protein